MQTTATPTATSAHEAARAKRVRERIEADAAAKLDGTNVAQLCSAWNVLDRLIDKARADGKQELNAVLIRARAWTFEALERRDPAAMDAWVASDDDDPTPFFLGARA